MMVLVLSLDVYGIGGLYVLHHIIQMQRLEIIAIVFLTLVVIIVEMMIFLSLIHI